jgi:hypothetical protein
MQSDNNVNSPEDYISYNRYAYCLYNPFKYTDPSGEVVTYFDSNFLNEVSKTTQNADSYGEGDHVGETCESQAQAIIRGINWVRRNRFCSYAGSMLGSYRGENLTSSWGAGGSSEGGSGSKNHNNGSKYEFYNPNTKQNILNDISHSDGRMLMTIKKTDGDPSTQNQNLDGTNFVGWNNAMTYDNQQDFNAPCYIQSDPPAKYHDKRYTNVGHWTGKQTGSWGFLLDTRMIGADFRFVVDELKVSQNPDVPHYIRDNARTYAFAIGVAAIPKTIFQLMKPFPLNIWEIQFYDNLSNINP